MASAYANKSNVYRYQRNPQQAILWMQKRLDVQESLRKASSDVIVRAIVRAELAFTFRILGDLHKMQGEFPKAVEYYQKSDATFQELARIYMTQHQHELSQLETAIRSLKRGDSSSGSFRKMTSSTFAECRVSSAMLTASGQRASSPDGNARQ